MPSAVTQSVLSLQKSKAEQQLKVLSCLAQACWCTWAGQAPSPRLRSWIALQPPWTWPPWTPSLLP